MRPKLQRLVAAIFLAQTAFANFAGPPDALIDGQRKSLRLLEKNRTAKNKIVIRTASKWQPSGYPIS